MFLIFNEFLFERELPSGLEGSDSKWF